MSISIYGEIALDWLVSQNGTIKFRKGGAGLYAALSVAKAGKKAELLTIVGQEINDYSLFVWNNVGVSFQYAKKDINYSIPRYLVTGFENYAQKVSRPMVEIKNNYDYSPDLPTDSEGVLIFPINHAIPKEICIEAKRRNVPIFLDPKPNEGSIDDARRTLEYIDVLLVNEEELLLLSTKEDVSEAIKSLLKMGPKYIVVKLGVKGCIVAEVDKNIKIIPSYKSEAICTLGSGDVFGGALIATFIETKDMEYSVKFASCMAACFIENFEIEHMPNRRAIESYMKDREILNYSTIKKIIIYLAGPFFNQQELLWVNYIHQSLESCGLLVLSPSKENGIIKLDTVLEERKKIFNSDIELIQKSDIVVALLDYRDPGTSFEIGYAYSRGIPIIGLRTSEGKLNNMIEFGCNVICDTVDKLISEVYKYATE